MKFLPECRTNKLGMVYTILGSDCSFFNWEGADVWLQIRLKKIPERKHVPFKPPDKSALLNKKSCFSTKTYVVGTQKNCLNEMVL